MDFREATDRATETCITLASIAEACGVTHHSVRRARLEQGTDSYRSPPDGWRAAVAKLARKRAAELEALADSLEA